MKTKIVMLVGLAFCTMLLVSPALASDAGTLEIYGNANEDDTIDMRDLTYVKLIFFGKKPETELADAKYDGKINPLDFIQIKLIIVGKEKELTIVDSADRIVTVKKPVERIIPLQRMIAAVARSFGAGDKVIAVTESIKRQEAFVPKISKLPSIGTVAEQDYEEIIELEPDIVVQHVYRFKEELEEKLEPAGIAVLYLNFNYPPIFTEEVKKLGYILNKRDEAEEFIDWHQGYLDTITARTEGLSEEDKTRIYMCWGSEHTYTFGEDNIAYPVMMEMAGGINIADDLPGEWIMVDPEWIVKQNPPIIMKFGTTHTADNAAGYEVDDTSEAAALRDDIMNHPAFALTDAAKEGDVYIFGGITDHGCYLITVAYMAKLFQPDLFEDMDPKAIQQEYLTRFQHLDYDVYEHGVFLYPIPWKE